jgi:hypothetical protein
MAIRIQKKEYFFIKKVPINNTSQTFFVKQYYLFRTPTLALKPKEQF